VVESWTWTSAAMSDAAEEFARGQYRWLVTVGEEDPSDQRDSPGLAARRLRQLGVDGNRIVALPVPHVRLHRTYASAVAVKKWLQDSGSESSGINVFTLGAHARKSLVLFSRALGPTLRVGVVAGSEDTFDARRWWLSRRGVYVIVRKTAGYLYAVWWPFPDAAAPAAVAMRSAWGAGAPHAGEPSPSEAMCAVTP
jgi:hypothetical protein